MALELSVFRLLGGSRWRIACADSGPTTKEEESILNAIVAGLEEHTGQQGSSPQIWLDRLVF